MAHLDRGRVIDKGHYLQDDRMRGGVVSHR